MPSWKFIIKWEILFRVDCRIQKCLRVDLGFEVSQLFTSKAPAPNHIFLAVPVCINIKLTFDLSVPGEGLSIGITMVFGHPKIPLFELPIDVNLSLLQMGDIFLRAHRRVWQGDFTYSYIPQAAVLFSKFLQRTALSGLCRPPSPEISPAHNHLGAMQTPPPTSPQPYH